MKRLVITAALALAIGLFTSCEKGDGSTTARMTSFSHGKTTVEWIVNGEVVKTYTGSGKQTENIDILPGDMVEMTMDTNYSPTGGSWGGYDNLLGIDIFDEYGNALGSTGDVVYQFETGYCGILLTQE